MDDSEDFGLEAIRELLGTADMASYCPTPRTLYVRHRAKRGEHIAMRVGCDAWCCRPCGERKRDRYGVHIAIRFLSSSHTVSVESCRPDQWEAMKKRLGRSGSGYAKIEDPNGGWWVFSTGPGGPCDASFPTVGEAISALGECLRMIEPRKTGRNAKPVILCRTWSLPKRSGEYEFAGLLPLAKLGALTDALRAANVPMRESGRDDRREWGVQFRLDTGQEVVFRNGTPEVVQPDEFG